MANLVVDIPADFASKINQLSANSEELIKKMLNAGCDVLEPEIKKNLQIALNEPKKYRQRSTGALLGSIDRMKPNKRTKDDIWQQRIRFKGKSEIILKDGTKRTVRNGDKAAYIEYGKPNIGADQPPRPFIRSAVMDKENEIHKAMQDVFDKELKK